MDSADLTNISVISDSENLMRLVLTREAYLPTKVTCDFEDASGPIPMNHPIKG